MHYHKYNTTQLLTYLFTHSAKQINNDSIRYKGNGLTRRSPAI